MVGAKGTITSKKGTVSKKTIAQLLTLTETTWALNFILNVSPTRKTDVRQSDIDAMEKTRNELFKIKDNDLRFRCFLAQNISALLIPELAKIHMELGLPKDFLFKEGVKREDIDLFLEEIPTALCFFTLIYYRDQLRTRKIQANDFNDIWSLFFNNSL